MTVTIRAEKIGKHLIEIKQEKFESVYHVAMYEEQGEGLYGHARTDLVYDTEKKAQARFNALRRSVR